MSILNILHFPDNRLRKKANEVTVFDDAIRTLVADMFETMYAAPGIGLAATQVNVHKRILVMDISEQNNEPMCLINPEIIATEGEEEQDEGCLSVPGFYEKVQRAEKIQVKAKNELGQEIEIEADGLKAVCIQHEMDHLDGKLFVDYISSLKRMRIQKKLEKQKKQGTLT
ncbi:MAG: peptide deformylase [Gammaproteobacteria bacterium]|nr:peptide deformylase [Gammaproteobacteria bacterium]